jgi:hypothetical protein
MAPHSPPTWVLGRYSMHHNKRRRAILRLFATLLKTGHEINLILCLGIEGAEAWDCGAGVSRVVVEASDATAGDETHHWLGMGFCSSASGNRNFVPW